MKTCPNCGHVLQPAKAKAVKTLTHVDTESMTTAELYAHYKKTAPLEDCRSFAKHPYLSPDLTLLTAELLYDVQNSTMSRAETYKRLTALQDRWRQEKYWQRIIVPAERLARRLRKSYARMPYVTASSLEYACR